MLTLIIKQQHALITNINTIKRNNVSAGLASDFVLLNINVNAAAGRRPVVA